MILSNENQLIVFQNLLQTNCCLTSLLLNPNSEGRNKELIRDTEADGLVIIADCLVA